MKNAWNPNCFAFYFFVVQLEKFRPKLLGTRQRTNTHTQRTKWKFLCTKCKIIKFQVCHAYLSKFGSSLSALKFKRMFLKMERNVFMLKMVHFQQKNDFCLKSAFDLFKFSHNRSQIKCFFFTYVATSKKGMGQYM